MTRARDAEQRAWWLASDDADPDSQSEQRCLKLQSVAAQVYDSQASSTTRAMMMKNARLYGNFPMAGLSPRLYRQTLPRTGSSARLSYNLVKSCCDSYVAQLVEDKPKVSFVTDGADWGMRRKASLLEKFTDGVMYDADFQETAMAIALDSAIFGVGHIQVKAWNDEHPGDDEDRICMPRVFPWELFDEESDAAYGTPRSKFRIRYVDKGWAKAVWPKFAERIDTAKASPLESATHTDSDGTATDLITIVEAWHLQSTEEAADGRHILCIGDVAIIDEGYEDDGFPFVSLYRTRPLVGTVGQSLADDLCGVQLEINVLMAKIQRSHHLLAAGHWLISRASKVNTNGVDNQIGSLIYYDGIMPRFEAPPAVSGDVYAHLDRLIQYGYQMTGISQTNAGSQKPAGVDSGEAIRAYGDIATQRFTVCYREFQHFFLRASRQILKTARRMAATGGDLAVKFNSGNLMRKIKWSDVNLDESDYVMKMYPTNSLAKEPAGRLSQVTDMFNTGMIDQATAMRLADMPDLEAYSDQKNASYNLTMKMAEMILDQTGFIAPMETMNLQESIPLMRDQMNKAVVDGAPQEVVDSFDTWLTQAMDAVNRATPPPPPAPAMPPGLPAMGGLPGQPPPKPAMPQPIAA